MNMKIFTFEIHKNNEYNNPDIDVQIDPHKETIVATDLKGAMYEMYPNMRYKWHVYRPWDHHPRGLYIWAHWITYNEGYTRKTENYRIITCKMFDDIGSAYRGFDDSDVEHMLNGYEPIFVLKGESGTEYGIYRTYNDAHDHIDEIKEKGFAIELKWVHP